MEQQLRRTEEQTWSVHPISLVLGALVKFTALAALLGGKQQET